MIKGKYFNWTNLWNEEEKRRRLLLNPVSYTHPIVMVCITRLRDTASHSLHISFPFREVFGRVYCWQSKFLTMTCIDWYLDERREESWDLLFYQKFSSWQWVFLLLFLCILATIDFVFDHWKCKASISDPLLPNSCNLPSFRPNYFSNDLRCKAELIREI